MIRNFNSGTVRRNFTMRNSPPLVSGGAKKTIRPPRDVSLDHSNKKLLKNESGGGPKITPPQTAFFEDEKNVIPLEQVSIIIEHPSDPNVEVESWEERINAVTCTIIKRTWHAIDKHGKDDWAHQIIEIKKN